MQSLHSPHQCVGVGMRKGVSPFDQVCGGSPSHTNILGFMGVAGGPTELRWLSPCDILQRFLHLDQNLCASVGVGMKTSEGSRDLGSGVGASRRAQPLAHTFFRMSSTRLWSPFCPTSNSVSMPPHCSRSSPFMITAKSSSTLTCGGR